MSYEYRRSKSSSNVGIQVIADTPEELFTEAADAVMNVMVDDLEHIHRRV